MSKPQVTVDAGALREVLVALLGAPHRIRELQVLHGMHPTLKGEEDPISTLVRQYEESTATTGEPRR